MEMSYDPQEDILFICFNKEPIVRDISYGWHVNVGMTEQGIGQITILEAKAAGLLPVYLKSPSEWVTSTSLEVNESTRRLR